VPLQRYGNITAMGPINVRKRLRYWRIWKPLQFKQDPAGMDVVSCEVDTGKSLELILPWIGIVSKVRENEI